MFGRRLSTISFWRFAATAVFVAGVFSLNAAPTAAEGGKILAHQRGSVQYMLDGSTKTIYTRLPVPDNATAITGPKSLATLTLPDSSEIDIGERTNVAIGAFNNTGSGKTNLITLNNGALHFVIRHPVGTNANYTFQTPTSQIAIRGTEGFIIQNAGGTSLTITSGTASITAVASGVTVAVPAGTTGVVSASGAATVSTTTSTLSVSSISGTSSASSSAAATGAASGATASTTAAVAGGTAAAAGAAVASTSSKSTPTPTPVPSPSAIVLPSPTPIPSASPTPVPSASPTPVPSASPTPVPSASPTPAPSSSPTVAPSPSPTPTAGPFLIAGGAFPPSSNEVFATFPHAFSTQEITQANCSTNATISVTGPATINTTTLPCTGGAISSSFGGQYSTFGAAVFTISGSGQTVNHTEDVFGPVAATIAASATSATATITGSDSTISVGSVNVTTVPQTLAITINQPGPTTVPVTFTSTLNCSNVSTATNANTFIGIGSAGNFSSSANSYAIVVAAAPTYTTPPTTAPPYACLLTIEGISESSATGTGTSLPSASEVQLQISVTAVSVGITSDRRRLETSPGQRKIPTK